MLASSFSEMGVMICTASHTATLLSVLLMLLFNFGKIKACFIIIPSLVPIVSSASPDFLLLDRLYIHTIQMACKAAITLDLVPPWRLDLKTFTIAYIAILKKKNSERFF